MQRLTRSLIAKARASSIRLLLHDTSIETQRLALVRFYVSGSAVAVSSSSPSLSIWRRKKEMTKEGLIAAKELKRLQSNPVRLHRFILSHVSRLLKSDIVSVLAEFQRQNQVFLSMKMDKSGLRGINCKRDNLFHIEATKQVLREGSIMMGGAVFLSMNLYDVVRKEIWYRPDMFFYRDMLMMLARNRKVDESRQVWEDLKKEQVLFDQHTFGDLVRVYLDSGLPSEAMDIYDEMRQSPDPPLSLPFRVILKGLIPYPELREKVKDDFLELFPDMIVYDPPEDLFEDQELRSESEVE
ncbi:hypothetical protein GOBAR_DD01962 [Gossypium barbadense]|nr:hypothetical protein GOBAR_DD01962 [Gossypium barbadense]